MLKPSNAVKSMVFLPCLLSVYTCNLIAYTDSFVNGRSLPFDLFAREVGTPRRISAFSRARIMVYVQISSRPERKRMPREPDIDIREVLGCTCMRLRRANRTITQIYDQHLAPAGLTSSQFGMLARLHG